MIASPEPTPLAEIEQRAIRLQALMREEGVDGVLATQNADVFYLSGVIQQAQAYLPAEGLPLLMVRKHPGRAEELSTLPGDRVKWVRSLNDLAPLIEWVGGRPKRIGLEFDTLPVTTYLAYQKALSGLGAAIVDGSMLFRRVRMLKSDFEVEMIRKAAIVSDVGVQAAAGNMREGITELELAALVEASMRTAGHSGAIRMRFYGQEMHMGHLLAGESGALPSFMNSPTGGPGTGPWAPYGAGERPIGRGEPVLLDYCGEWGGYLGDQTRMLSLGPLDSFWNDAYAAMLDVETYLAGTAQAGMTSGDVYRLAEERAQTLGYGAHFMGPPPEESPGQKVPFVGHAVGLELDELPPLQRGTSTPLEARMVLAIEPKLIYPGRGAIGIEDTYLLTPDGLTPLTFSRRDIVQV